ncbi:hypothetical protein AB0N05_33450 [Nocardia sp. NPDC051030]|uniref:hypothetical protein n=1 Tax=Nocardia sp. NPDC051030 TaxID=3155162 RepID=UPI003441413A
MAKKAVALLARIAELLVGIIAYVTVILGITGVLAMIVGIAKLSSDKDASTGAFKAGGVALGVAVLGLVLIVSISSRLPERPPKPAPAPSRKPQAPGFLVGVPMHSTVELALRAAAAQTIPEPLNTQRLLVTLMRADSSGQWYRLWLHAGGIKAITGKFVLDPTNYTAATWDGVPLTFACARALDISARLSHRYDIWPLTVGMVTIGLIADQSSGAAQALTDNLDRETLLEILQTDVLGVRLTNLDDTLTTILSEMSGPAWNQ